MLDETLVNVTKDKVGVEIGGPSGTGNVIYKHAAILDNIVFSNDTVWANHTEKYNYYPNKQGNVIINDAVSISKVSDNAYDFVFSSHCLEHIANPMKAVQEWLRILKPEGHLIIVVPEKSHCFDHQREYSSFSTLLSQYEKNVGEDDLSTLQEILRKHDLRLDPWAGSFENFTKRSLDNYKNRCLHHYVYNPKLLNEICAYFKCKGIYTITNGLNIWFIMQKTSS
jgi:SAM-dependent methyltransferase